MTDDETDPGVPKTATCQTETCTSYQKPVNVVLPDGALVICGKCSQPITDITDRPDITSEEVPTWLTS